MYTQLTLLIRNHGCNLTVSPFNTFQARFKEFGGVGLSSTQVYKVFCIYNTTFKFDIALHKCLVKCVINAQIIRNVEILKQPCKSG